MPIHVRRPARLQNCLLGHKHRCSPRNICISRSLWRTHESPTHTHTHTHTHTSSIYSSHPSSGTLVSKLRVFPAAKLSVIQRPCLTLPAPEMPPQFLLAPSFLSTLPALSFPRPSPSLLSLASIPQKESHQAQDIMGVGPFSPYGNFISKNSKPWPCPPLPWWLLIFPLAQNATGWGGLRGVPAALTGLWESPRSASTWLGAGGQCCLGRPGVLDRGGLRAHLLSSTHSSQLSWELSYSQLCPQSL